MHTATHPLIRNFSILYAALALSACGGGGGEGPPAAAADASAGTSAAAVPAAGLQADGVATRLAVPGKADGGITLQQRVQAATATAGSSVNACAAVRPFYWEIGDRSSTQASGAVANTPAGAIYRANTALPMASASKWIYSAYVAQKQNGVLSATDRKFLQMQAGFVSLDNCSVAKSVDSCLAMQGNGTYTASADGKFDYNGGHMQAHASLSGMGPLTSAGLAPEIQRMLGAEVPALYTQPLLAGGLQMTPSGYAVFLRKLLGGQLQMSNLLGTSPVCTNPATCGTQQALFSPLPATESWHYSLGHWVEDDPVTGDGAFSSGGYYGFYPWIDATKTNYGIVARYSQDGYWPSIQCGRLIRKAWANGTSL